MIPLGWSLSIFSRGDIVGMDLAVNVGLADAPCYELSVLRTKIKDEDHSVL